mmetsp:Transcript_15688/g.28447  ORF Transcript_15688/g.28447 Transcript_15688/m.28447 type:complete len:676 (-) Transcript_15688:472-2499(-)
MFSFFNRSRRGSTMGNSSSSSGNDDSNGDGNERRPALANRGLSHRIVGGGSNNNAHRIAGLTTHLTLPSSLPSPFRTGGSLGLSRSELDDRCKPSGLYPSCEWEPKQIRRLISNGNLAARLKGNDARLTKTDRECPICFMYYSESNVSKCCNATLCTECYLQVKPQKDRCTTCPFCNNPKMMVTVQRGMDEGDVAKREEEEQMVIEATIRSRVSRLHGEGPVDEEGPGGDDDRRDSGETASEGSFGSSLENYNRARTMSASSNVSAHSNSSDPPGAPGTPIRPSNSGDSDSLLSLAMSPADRRALESEMRAQLSHETHRRTEREAEEARMRHAQEWYGSQAGSRSRVREARLSELTSLLERMSARGDGVSTAPGGGGSAHEDGEGENPLMAMGADTGPRGAGGRDGAGGASLSRLLRAMETSSNSRGGGGNSSLEDLMRLEAAFFLGSMDDDTAASRARQRNNNNTSTLLGRTNRNNDADETNDDDAEAPDGLMGLAHFGRSASSPFGLGSGSSSVTGHRRVVRRMTDNHRRVVRRMTGTGNRGVSSTHLDTAELLMRGVSEEEQLAMAIAMSMQDSQEQPPGEGERAEAEADDDDVGERERGQADNHLLAEESGEDDDSSSSGSSSSDSSEEGEDDQSNTTDENEEGNNDDSNDDAASLEDDEEEITFTDLASV